jgi:hypothetical protein
VVKADHHILSPAISYSIWQGFPRERGINEAGLLSLEAASTSETFAEARISADKVSARHKMPGRRIGFRGCKKALDFPVASHPIGASV